MDLTRALYRAVHGWPHGTEALAAALGMSRNSLLHKVNPAYPGAHPSPEEALAIMQTTGDHGAHHAQGAQLGYIHLPAPALLAVASDETAAELAASVREFGEFITRVAADLADGRCTANELMEIEREGGEAIVAMQRLLALARRLYAASVPAGLRVVAGGPGGGR